MASIGVVRRVLNLIDHFKGLNKRVGVQAEVFRGGGEGGVKVMHIMDISIDGIGDGHTALRGGSARFHLFGRGDDGVLRLVTSVLIHDGLSEKILLGWVWLHSA